MRNFTRGLICSVDDCERDVNSRGMCKSHYERWRLQQVVPKPCIIDGCVLSRFAKGWCRKHYTRWKRHGDPEAPLTRQPQKGLICSAIECDLPARSLGLCAGHARHMRRTGDPNTPFKYKWAEAGMPCTVCGGGTKGRRSYCGPNCSQLAHTWGGADRIPRSFNCVLCGVEVDLFSAGRNHGNIRKTSNRKRRADSHLCPDCCRQRKYRHGHSAQALAARDGITCQLCGLAVDMTLSCPARVAAPMIRRI